MIDRRTAIISVYDKKGILELAEAFVAHDVEILSTGGTYSYLVDNNISVWSISEYTGAPEILDGRVKSLHPKVHGGILARRDREDDLEELRAQHVSPIDYVVVNLYPFLEQLKKEGVSADSLVEFIDVGGPTMLRAAAKNCRHVVPICDPTDYPLLIRALENPQELPLALRQHLAAKVFSTLADYDAHVAYYFSQQEKAKQPATPAQISDDGWPLVKNIFLNKRCGLRYGENPHQRAALYSCGTDQEPWTQLQGKELSYNNLVDTAAAVDLLLECKKEVSESVCVIIKHTNPCGVAVRANPYEAFLAARTCDPVSAFGGIIALSGPLDARLAQEIVTGFVEVIACADVSTAALEILAKKKNIRLLRVERICQPSQLAADTFEIKKCLDHYLLQTVDPEVSAVTPEQLIVGNKADLSAESIGEVNFAWRISKHVKSNAIVVAKDRQLIGVGAGQMNRVDAAKLSIMRAQANGFSTAGAVAASDAFLPFPDTLEVLVGAGIKTLVQPGGSIRDEEVIRCAEANGVNMFFTGQRHFRH